MATPGRVPPRPDNPDAPLPRGLRQWRAAARVVLLIERVWPALWPAGAAAGIVLCVALLGLPSLLPPLLHLALLLAALALIGLLAARGIGRIVVPDAAAADRRLEQASGLRHQPLSVLTDRPAAGTGSALWRAHVARAVAQLGRLRTGRPRTAMAARDPRALRAALIVAVAACIGIAGADAPARIGQALWPRLRGTTPVPPALVQAWITPPAYTGLAPVFLRPASAGGGDAAEVSVPAGSHLTVSVTGGGAETPDLLADGRGEPFRKLDDGSSFQADRDLSAGGTLAVTRGGRSLAEWHLAVVADVPPEVQFPEPPGAARASGRVPLVRLPWRVEHAYGVASLQAELRLRDRADDPPLIVSIPLPGGAPKRAHGARQQDLTSHPWSGLPVIARLVARDAPGLVGTSEDAAFDLPERHFDNPVAQALMAARKRLTLQPGERRPVIEEMDRLAMLPDVWADDSAGFLNLRGIAALLHRGRGPAVVTEAQGRMWQLALHLEEGAPDRTARTLAEARRDLREALDAQQRGQKVDPAEIDRKIEQLQRALREHLQALAEQARRDPDAQTPPPDAAQMDPQALDKLTQEMRDAERQGDQQTAREKMAELEQMLDALQAGRQPSGKQDRARAEKRQRGDRQMDALQDMIQRQRGIMDHAQARTPPDDQQRSPADPPRPPPATPGGSDAAADTDQRGGDGAVQRALRRALGELMQQYGDLTGKVPPNLGEADLAMRDGAQALGQGNDPAAAGAAQRAIEALQKGGQSMAQTLSMQFGPSGGDSGDEAGQEGEQASTDGDDGGGDQGSGDSNNSRGRGHGTRPGQRQFGDRHGDIRRDPLGRPLKDGTSGTEDSADVQVPDQMEEARTRAIQDELRRRGADRGRPQPELDYIDRLLKQF